MKISHARGLAPERRHRQIERVTRSLTSRFGSYRRRHAPGVPVGLCAIAVCGAALAAEPVPAVAPALQAVADKMRAIRTLQVRMRQEKEIRVLAETVKSTGTLTFARPRRLAIDLQGEGGTKLVIDGDAMITVYKALGRTERTSLSKDPRARAVAEHLFLLLEAEPKALAAV